MAFALPHVKRMLLLLRAPSRSRTYNPRIKSPLLCQLSYRGVGGASRYKLVCCSLQGVLADSRSKSYSAGALAWFALHRVQRCAI